MFIATRFRFKFHIHAMPVLRPLKAAYLLELLGLGLHLLLQRGESLPQLQSLFVLDQHLLLNLPLVTSLKAFVSINQISGKYVFSNAGQRSCNTTPEKQPVFCKFNERMLWNTIYLLSDLMPLHLQHLLLLVGVIDDVLSTDQQLALHRLTKQQRKRVVLMMKSLSFLCQQCFLSKMSRKSINQHYWLDTYKNQVNNKT